jgi:hypothetical protein
MKRTLLLLAFTTSFAARAVHGQAGTQTLDSLRDHARPLLVFSPSANDPRAEKQLQIISPHAAEANDRAMPVITLAHDAPVTVFSLTEQKNLRSRFHIAPNQFVVILIGKDGGEKLRSAQPIAYEKLAATIDAMPMRQSEQQKK